MSNSLRRSSFCSASQTLAWRTAASSCPWSSPSTPVRPSISSHTCFAKDTDSIRRAYTSRRSRAWARASGSGTFLALPGDHSDGRGALRA
ncbi:hypothetical protein ACFYXM_34275 [Streptomyces sp. NPDC002476]|uniref:hypothetical protein n=1 Tax=Streptomyces sp. NPDC002476 TaxID=3364648 RepID=UPI0036C20EC4